MLGMLEVLVVLKELVVFVGGIIDRVKSLVLSGGNYRIQKEIFMHKKRSKKKTKSKIHLYF